MKLRCLRFLILGVVTLPFISRLATVQAPATQPNASQSSGMQQGVAASARASEQRPQISLKVAALPVSLTLGRRIPLSSEAGSLVAQTTTMYRMEFSCWAKWPEEVRESVTPHRGLPFPPSHCPRAWVMKSNMKL